MKSWHLYIAFGTIVSFIPLLPCRADGLDFIKQGQAAEKAGKRNAALVAYTRAIKAGDLTEEQLAFAYYRRGAVKAFLADSVSAIEDFSKSIESNPKSGMVYNLRGYLRGVIGQYDLAEKDHIIAIELATEAKGKALLPLVLANAADVWRRRGMFDKALEYCDKAAEAGSEPGIAFRRAWIYLDMGRTDQAKSEFDKFEQHMKRQKLSYDVFWPDERGAMSRLRELTDGSPSSGSDR